MLAVTFYRDRPDKPAGMPGEWPFSTRLIQDASEALEGETVFTDEEYSDYIEQWRPAYLAWEASRQPAPIAIDWDQFRAEISAHPAYLRLASATPQNLALNSLITALLWQVGSRPELLAEVAIKWNLMVDGCPLELDEVAALNEIAERCGLPLRLSEGGRIQ